MLENRIHFLLLALILSCVFISYMVPIADIDFWWHIATGRVILDTWSIPTIDPFFVFNNGDPIRNETILKGYWLGQVVLFSVYDQFASVGIIIFRALILTACVTLIYFRMRLFKATGLILWLPLLFAALALQGFTGERPQLFSFFFIGLLMLFWDLFQIRGERFWLLPLPFIIAIWSNIHGGFLLAIAVMGILAGTQVLSPLGRSKYFLKLTGWSGFLLIMVLASLLNPNSFKTYLLLLQSQGGELQTRTSEYTSSLAIYNLDLWFEQLVVMAVFIIALLAIYYAFRQRSWDKALVIIFLVLISIDAYRYLAFLVIATTPYFAKPLSALETRITGSFGIDAGKWLQWCSVIFAFIFLSASILRHNSIRPNDRFYELHRGLAQIKQIQGTGRAFNTMNVGGYLIWHLNPNIRTFIDGRLLNEEKLVPYTHMLWTTEYGKKWFEQARFDWVIMSTRNSFTGESYTLVPYLLGQENWGVFFKTDDWIILKRDF